MATKSEEIEHASTFLPNLKEDFKFTAEEIKETSKHDERVCYKFKGGEEAALKRLEKYLKKSVLSYEKTRNNLIGSDYSSKLSPWLANGSLSAKKIYQSVAMSRQNDSTKVFIDELFWRDFQRY